MPRASSPTSANQYIPVVLVAFILSYMGVEASATHVNEMENPMRDYPMAMFLLMICAIGLSSIGGLSVAAVIPESQINLSAGVVQTFQALISSYGAYLEWIVRIIAAILMLGVVAEITSWIVGPSRGMYVTAQKGLLPKAMGQSEQERSACASGHFPTLHHHHHADHFHLRGGGSNMSFLIALALTVVLYLITYFLLSSAT
jgi:amino acid transporter